MTDCQEKQTILILDINTINLISENPPVVNDSSMRHEMKYTAKTAAGRLYRNQNV